MKADFIKPFLVTTLLALSAKGQAEITYVDALEGTAGNTFATDGSLDNLSWLDPAGGVESNTSQWAKRTGFANGGTIFQAWHFSSPGQMPEIVTEVNGLPDGLYDTWTFFWDASGANVWSISTGLTSGDLTSYSFDGQGDTTSPIAASTLTFTNNPVTAESNRILYGVKVGQVSVTGGSPLRVYIDNLIGDGSNNRSWYDGIGYAPALVSETNTLQISSLTLVDDGLWELTLTGERSTPYKLVSSTNLNFDDSVALTGLTQEVPEDPGTISGVNNQIITPDQDGNAVVRVGLGDLAINFLRIETVSE